MVFMYSFNVHIKLELVYYIVIVKKFFFNEGNDNVTHDLFERVNILTVLVEILNFIGLEKKKSIDLICLYSKLS